MMKVLKKIIISLGILFLILRLSIFVFRLPSYKIQTSGKLYVVSKLSEDVQVLDLFSGEEIAEIPIEMLSYEAAATLGGSKVVMTDFKASKGNVLKVIDTETNKIEKTIGFNKSIKANGIVRYSEPNKVVVIDRVNDDLLLINIETDSIEKQISTQQEKSHLVLLHPKEKMAYVTNVSSGSISVIDLNLNEVVKIIPCGIGRKGLAITPNGSELWVSNTNNNTITIIDTVTNSISRIIKSGNESLQLKFSKDGKYCLVVNATDGVVSIYEQQSKKKIKTITLHGKSTIFERLLYHTPRPVSILMHPNGLYAFVANSNANRVEVIDMKTFKIVSTIGTGKVPDALVFVE